MFNIFPTGCNRLEDLYTNIVQRVLRANQVTNGVVVMENQSGKQMEHEMEAGFIQGFIGTSANTAVPDDLPSSL